MVKIYIDDRPVEVPKGENLIEAAKRLETEIPHYCYHPKLSVSGNCRMCLVEMGMPMRDRSTGEPVLDEATGEPKIQWMPKPVIACATQAAQGMRVRTQSDLVKQCQEGVMEFLLVNHPLDCPICDKAGECSLQEFATEYGQGYSRYVEPKNKKPKRVRLGPRVILDDERCILCSRCVRFCEEVVGEKVLGFTDHGSHTTLGCYPGKELDNNYSLNTVDICPVGALTSEDFRFKMRVWFLKKTPSICTESSVGVNTDVWSREGVIHRITPRRNDAVNDTWMSDSGRMRYKELQAEDRLSQYILDNSAVDADLALQQAADWYQSGRMGYVVSAHASVEEQWALAQLIQARPGPVYLVPHIGEDDGILISSDRTPNRQGALATGLVSDLDAASSPQALQRALDSGAIDTLLVVRESLETLTLPSRAPRLLYLGTHFPLNPQTYALLLPGLSVFEKSGSFINRDRRLQAFEAAVPGPCGVPPDWQTLLALLPEPPACPTLQQLRSALAQDQPALAALATGLPREGLALDAEDTEEASCELPVG